MDKSTRTRAYPRTRTRGQRMRRCERRDMKRLFLATYSRYATLRTSCRVLKLARGTVYAWIASDPLFKHKLDLLIAALYAPEWFIEDVSKAEIKAFQQKRKAGKRLIRYYAEYERKQIIA